MQAVLAIADNNTSYKLTAKHTVLILVCISKGFTGFLLLPSSFHDAFTIDAVRDANLQAQNTGSTRLAALESAVRNRDTGQRGVW